MSNRIDRDAIEEVAHRLRSWADAYPEDIFKPISKDEMALVVKAFPGFPDRQAAAMGRHIRLQMIEMATILDKALGKESDEHPF